MNRADESVLAWSLLEAASPFLPPVSRVEMCVKIGAGDQVGAIHDLLHFMVEHMVELPTKPSVLLKDWVYGYRGSDCETLLAALLTRLRVPEPNLPTSLPQPTIFPQDMFDRRPKRMTDRYVHEELARPGPALHFATADDLSSGRSS